MITIEKVFPYNPSRDTLKATVSVSEGSDMMCFKRYAFLPPHGWVDLDIIWLTLGEAQSVIELLEEGLKLL